MSNNRKKSKKAAAKDQDLRKLSKDKRPKPSTGQSAEEFKLGYADLTANEVALVKACRSTRKDDLTRPTRDVEYLSELFNSDNPKLVARNTIRRLVPSGWLERVDRGSYRLTEKAVRRLENV